MSLLEERAGRAERTAETPESSSARPAGTARSTGEEGAGVSRRKFLKVLGVAGGSTLAATACGSGQSEKLIPYLIPVDDQVPGVATWYATTCRECPAGCGLHVRVREGRAVKLEGNPDHPINRGKLCARGQAGLQGLYNPDRVRGPLAKNAAGAFEPVSWQDAVTRVGERLGQAPAQQVWFVTGNEAGTFDRLVSEWMAGLGSSNRVVFEPFGYEALRHATQHVFGTSEPPYYDFAAARYVLSFGADFLETWGSPVEQTRGFTSGHAFANGKMGRLVHVEPRMSLTGQNADEWIAPVPGTEWMLALSLAHVIVRDRLGSPPAETARLRPALQEYAPDAVAPRCGVSAETIQRLAREFTAGPSLAAAGGMGAQHADAHATAAATHLLNYVAGNVGKTVVFGVGADPAAGSSYQRISDLVQAMQGGKVAVLLVHGANPAYATPAGLGFAAALAKVPFKISFSRFLDETAVQADLILPDHDPLEQWNDFEPRSGAHFLQQPVMQPVFDTRQTGDVLLDLARRMGGRLAQRLTAASYKDYLQDGWRKLHQQLGRRETFDDFWTTSLEQGGVWSEPRRRGAALAAGATSLGVKPAPSVAEGRFTLIVYPSSVFYDGRGANRPWLQELPDPVTKLGWSTWVEIHPDTAGKLGIYDGDMVEVASEAGKVEAVAVLYPGIRPDVLAMPLGQGHTAFGRYAKDCGANAYALLAAQPADFGGVVHYASVTLTPRGDHEKLPTRSGNVRQLDRGIGQAITLTALLQKGFEPQREEHAAPIPEKIEEVLDQWQEEQYQDWRNRGNYAGPHPKWGMAIDLSRCTGCSACVTACYAENNLAVVGKELMQRGREMSWIRIERYYEGGTGGEPLEVRTVPMLCQQCGNAPCEPVCPVFAAYHTPDGLNGQVYNRCVGTRYCSNNCPYKVRYFNWFDYQNPQDPAFAWPEPLHWQLNPDVTVRSKGVMEKCTFCVQRIRGAQHQARMRKSPLKDGEIQTACQQGCPADAIVFGDLNDPASRISQLATDGRAYHVLEGLNTRPSVTYLARVMNRAEA